MVTTLGDFELMGSYDEILSIFDYTKSFNSGFHTNFYVERGRAEEWISNKEMFFLQFKDVTFILRCSRDFYHLYFFYSNDEHFAYFIQKVVGLNLTLVIDLLGNSQTPSQEYSILRNIGFLEHQKLLRMRQGAIKRKTHRNKTLICNGVLKDIEQIKSLFEKNLDKYSEQIPNNQEIKKAVEKQQILVCSIEKKVVGLLYYDIQGARSHLKHWLVSSEFRGKGIGTALIEEYYNLSFEAKTFTLWVIASNESVIDIYNRHGYRFDGMYDSILLYESGR